MITNFIQHVQLFIGWIDWVFYFAAFAAAFGLARSSWMFWRQQGYKQRIQWALLEIQIPRETTRGPKAMEQVFASVFNLRNEQNGPKETWLDGEISRWFSLEIVGINKVTKFYLRLPRLLIHPFISSFYAQYPDIEIKEADYDYIDDFPPTYQELRADGYELYGLEITQKNDPAYVVNTYIEFEPKVGDEKGRILDSMASIMEIIGKMKPEETAWVQFLIVPDVSNSWLVGAKKIVEKMKSSTQGAEHGKGGNEPAIRLRFRTQGEDKTLKRIEDKKGKACFYVTIRMIYFAPRGIWNQDLLNRGIYGYVAQFSNDDQRFHKPNLLRTKVEWDSFPYFFPKRRLFWKQVALYDEYRRRFVPEETWAGKIYNSHLPLNYCFFHKPMLLSAEELATLFHIPTNIVMTQVTMNRIESKRLPAPSNLPK